MASMVTYQGFLQENTTRTQSTQASPQSPTTTMTTSQTVMSVIETHFQTIKLQVKDQKATQLRMDQCLLSVESQTCKISDNITALIKCAHKYKTPEG